MTPLVRSFIVALTTAALVSYAANASAATQTSTKVIYNFRGFPDGEFPHGKLAVDASGNFYGTTESGGPACHIYSGYGCGAVFEISPSTSGFTERLLYSFHGNTAKDGEEPEDGLILDASGALYGTTDNGGGTTGVGCSDGCGTVFKLTPGAKRYKETVLYRFQGGASDGSSPREGLLADSKGDLFGTTNGGGKDGYGTVFELSPSSTGYVETVIHAFAIRSPNCLCGGAFPTGGLIEDAAGALYGTTTEGGAQPNCGGDGCGTVFKLIPKGATYVERVLHSFAGYAHLDGSDPRAALVADSNGSLYGTTYAGGRNSCGGTKVTVGCGTVFKLTPEGSRYKESILYRFTGGANGSAPRTALLPLPGGTLYGTTEGGGDACYGSQECGTIFSLTPQGSSYAQAVLYRFEGSDKRDGAYPGATLTEVGGALYGTTIEGGTGHHAYACWTNPTGFWFGCGAMFRMTM
jgi:uncharacterized repeat protein (TIGR03803 family)